MKNIKELETKAYNTYEYIKNLEILGSCHILELDEIISKELNVQSVAESYDLKKIILMSKGFLIYDFTFDNKTYFLTFTINMFYSKEDDYMTYICNNYDIFTKDDYKYKQILSNIDNYHIDIKRGIIKI